jgi:hypothetical protein
VIVSRTPRRTLRCLRPGSHSRFGSHLNLIAEKIAPSFQALMWSPFCNPFIFTFMHVMGVCTPLLNVRTFKSANRSSTAVVERRSRSGRHVSACSDLSPLFSDSCALFCAFCTLQKLNSFLFKRFRTLCQKYRGWGYPLMTRGQNETTHCQFRCSVLLLLRTSHIRPSSGRFVWDGGKEGTSARKNQGMGCRSVTGCNSFQPWSASWT